MEKATTNNNNLNERKPKAPKLSKAQLIDVLTICVSSSGHCHDCPLNDYANCYKERHWQAIDMLEGRR